jgi:mycoredoxin
MQDVEQTRQIVFYGTSWCGDCWRASQVFERLKVPYQYVDIDRDENAADLVQQLNRGYRSVPTIVFPDGEVMVEPPNLHLLRKLSQFIADR